MYHNLFVTQNPPRRDEPDQGESEQEASLLVAEKGINFRYVYLYPIPIFGLARLHLSSSNLNPFDSWTG